MDKIEKIRQEIERRHKYESENYHDRKTDGRPNDGWAESLAIMGELEELLSFLDTLSEEPDTPEFPETFEICLYDGRTPNKENCNECSTTCSVRKEEPDKSLEKSVVDRELIKAAEFCYNYGTTSFPDKSLEEAAIDFADNAKKQLFAKDYAISSIADYDHGCIDGFKAGAKYETSKYTLIGTYNEDEYYIKKK